MEEQLQAAQDLLRRAADEAMIRVEERKRKRATARRKERSRAVSWKGGGLPRGGSAAGEERVDVKVSRA